MSELKAFDVILGQYNEDGSPCVVAVDADQNPRLLGDEKVYLKSDADKVIAEKNKEIEQLQAMLEERNKQVCELIEKNKRLANKDMIMASETIKDVLKELRHQKYKRCLDRVKWCDERIARYSLQQEIQQISWQKEIKFYRKLRDKYLELVEKFKEVK